MILNDSSDDVQHELVQLIVIRGHQVSICDKRKQIVMVLGLGEVF